MSSSPLLPQDSKLTVQKAEVLKPTVQKETSVPTLTPQTEQKAEASPTPKTAKDKVTSLDLFFLY